MPAGVALTISLAVLLAPTLFAATPDSLAPHHTRTARNEQPSDPTRRTVPRLVLQGVLSRPPQLAAAVNPLAGVALWREGAEELLEQVFGFVGVVGGEVADEHVEGDATTVGPGVHGEVGFCEQEHAGDAAGALVVGRETVKFLADQGQSGFTGELPAAGGQHLGVFEQCRSAVAIVEIGGEVQALHLVSPGAWGGR